MALVSFVSGVHVAAASAHRRDDSRSWRSRSMRRNVVESDSASGIPPTVLPTAPECAGAGRYALADCYGHCRALRRRVVTSWAGGHRRNEAGVTQPVA